MSMPGEITEYYIAIWAPLIPNQGYLEIFWFVKPIKQKKISKKSYFKEIT